MVDESVSFTTTPVRQVTVVAVQGSVDALTAPQLNDALDGALEGGPRAVVADLSQVDFLASAGMSALIIAHEKCSGSTAFGVVATGAIARPMRLVGIHETIPMFETLDEALSALEG
ncbi:STAS domain-containing protein [Mycolicibacterium sp. Dal123E01]|uniref:STAS domain-containing protein n=1 Tax=Mycolicibacterium sp. Dal123E01 TaxID=3457578 RepID=UPI00403E4DDC